MLPSNLVSIQCSRIHRNCKCCKCAVLLSKLPNVAEKPEDIYPYATFVLPDGAHAAAPSRHHHQQHHLHPASQTLRSGFSSTLAQAQAQGQVLVTSSAAAGGQGELPGTVRHVDMLVLHENTTLPLSDANSKSVRLGTGGSKTWDMSRACT